MKHTFKIALAAVAVASLSGAARADLTFQGAVGLPLNPTAQLPEQKGARVQLNYQDLGEDAKIYSLGGALRAGNSPFEISASVNSLDTGDDDGIGFGVGAKYLFSKETDPAKVRLAAGLGYNRYSVEDSDIDNVFGYLVASKYLGQVVEGRAPIIGHLGVRYDNFDSDGGDSSDKFSVYAGAEVPVTRKGDVQIVGEIGTKIVDGGDSPYSIGVRYRAANQPFGATIGLARQGLFSDDSKLFAQIGYTFNTK